MRDLYAEEGGSKQEASGSPKFWDGLCFGLPVGPCSYLSPIIRPFPLQSKGLAKAGRPAYDITGENGLSHSERHLHTRVRQYVRTGTVPSPGDLGSLLCMSTGGLR